MKIWYIHGAHSTHNSFNFIKTYLTDYDEELIDYETEVPLSTTIKNLATRLEQESDRVLIVAHSLGGIIAVALAQQLPYKVAAVVTLSTPFGGSGSATKALFMKPFDPFLMNASSMNPLLYTIRSTEVDPPIWSFITTKGGNSLINEDSDGVVTVASQMALRQGTTIEVPLNHFEVLISQRTADKIKSIARYVENTFEGVMT